jgi:hypothetical protein
MPGYFDEQLFDERLIEVFMVVAFPAHTANIFTPLTVCSPAPRTS